MDEKSNCSNVSVDEELIEGTSVVDEKEEAGAELEAAEDISRGGTDCKATGVGLEAAAAAAAAGEGPESETAADVSTEEIDSNSLVHKTSSSASSSRSPAVISRSSISSGSRISTNRPQIQSTSSEVSYLSHVCAAAMFECEGGTNFFFALFTLFLHLEKG